MAAEREAHHAADLDEAMMTRAVAGRGSEGGACFGRIRALPSGFHHQGSAHAYAAGYQGVKTPPAIADALNRLARR